MDQNSLQPQSPRTNAPLAATLFSWRGLILFAGAFGFSLAVIYTLVRSPEFESEAILGVPPSSVGLSQRLSPLIGAASLLGAGQSTVTPDLIADLGTTPEVLDSVLIDTLPLPRAGGSPLRYVDLFARGSEQGDPARLETARRALTSSLSFDVVLRSQTVRVAVRAESPSFARDLAQRLIRHLDRAMRKARIADAQGRHEFFLLQVQRYARDLRAAEDSLSEFVVRNRSIDGSPLLQTRRARLERAVEVAQASYLNLLGQRDLAAAETSESAPQIVVYSPPTLPYRPAQIGGKWIIASVTIATAGLIAALAILVSSAPSPTLLNRWLVMTNKRVLELVKWTR